MHALRSEQNGLLSSQVPHASQWHSGRAGRWTEGCFVSMVMMLLRRANVDQATGFSGLAGEWSGAGHRSVKGQIVKGSGRGSDSCT